MKAALCAVMLDPCGDLSLCASGECLELKNLHHKHSH